MPAGSTPGTTYSVVSLLDIYPTLIKLCGLPGRNDLDGIALDQLLADPKKIISRPVITTYDYGSYSVRWDQWHYIRYVDDSEELYDLDKDPEEWSNLAGDSSYAEVKARLITAIPPDPAPFPETSLIPLMEHHIAPIKSREHYFSDERRRWMQRFDVP
jgi:arylsulfatase A-like enzyme